MNELEKAISVAIQEIAVGPDRGRDISAELCEQVMTGILDAQIDDVRAAVFLIALRMKRESPDEMSGLTRAAQNRVVQGSVAVDDLVTLVDPFDGYSRTLTVSAFIPSVLAAMGIAALMHGVSSVGPKFGVTAHQVLSLAGIDCLNQTSTVARQVETCGWGYLDQSIYLEALHNLIPLRNKIIKRTAITTIERVLMPLRGQSRNHLALGYVHKAYPQIYAQIAKMAGFDTIHLNKGIEGGLMVAMNKPFARYTAELKQHPLRLDEQRFTAFENQTSVATYPAELSMSERVAESCAEGLKVLRGEESISRGSLIAATANIACSVRSDFDYTHAVEKAAQCIDNGLALEHFNAAIR